MSNRNNSNNNSKSLLDYLIAFTIAILIAFILFRCNERHNDDQELVNTDTLYITKQDTLREFTEVYKTIVKKDTFYVDSIIYIKDSTNNVQPIVLLDRVSKTYRDTINDDTITVFISGVNPSLDSLYISKLEKTIINNTFKTRKKKFSVGPQVGVGISTGGISPYIGIGLQYNLLSF